MVDDKRQEEMNTTDSNIPPQKEAPYRIITQFTKDMSFENVRYRGIFLGEPNQSGNIETGADVRVEAIDNKDNLFEVDIYTNVKAKNGEDEVVYQFEMNYASLVEFRPDVESTAQQELLFINIPMLMYPFIRQLILNQVLNSGYPPFYLNMIDFVGIYQRRLKLAREQVEKEAVDS